MEHGFATINKKALAMRELFYYGVRRKAPQIITYSMGSLRLIKGFGNGGRSSANLGRGG